MAVINIGSGSVKLYLEKTKKTYARVTLFASYINNSNLAALKDTFSAVLFFYKKATKCQEKVTIFGTEAMRQSDHVLIDMIFNKLGLKVDVISGEDEAICGFLGAIAYEQGALKKNRLTACDSNASRSDKFNKNTACMAVVDVGGASTELCVGISSPDFFVSLPIGAVMLYNKFDGDTKSHYEKAEVDYFLQKLFNTIDYFLSQLNAENYSKIDEIKLIGGGAYNLASILHNQKIFNLKKLNNTKVDLNTLPSIIKDLFLLSLSDRQIKYPFLKLNRAKILPFAISIIYRILSFLPQCNVFVSSNGLIEGYLILKSMSKNEGTILH